MKRSLRPVLVCLLVLGAASRAQTQAFPGGLDGGVPDGGVEPLPDDGIRRVPYLSETAKAAIKDEIRQEVLDQAKREGWAAPGILPDWSRNLVFSGDVRFRLERDLFPGGNANGGEFPDFNAINQGSPVDVNFVDTANERYLNVDQNKTRPRLRVRFGFDLDLGSGFSVGARLASGDGSTPVSTNQTLGGGPGDFSKYQFWLDKGYVRWQPIQSNAERITLDLGRFDNPFFVSDFLWSENVKFDGAALQWMHALSVEFKPYLAVGAFPIYTSSFTFPPQSSSKFAGLNKWLYAGQLGTDWRPWETVRIRFGASFFYFKNVEGRPSKPCDTNVRGVSCSSDESRASFAQKGNTYRAIRVPSELALLAEAASLVPRYQYFGLASHFRETVATGRVDVELTPFTRVSLEGELVRNWGFKPSEVAQVALNNFGRCTSSADCERFAGGRDGYMGRLSFGSLTDQRRWDWNVSAAYRYLQSDAVVDAFVDPDFGLGGTNLKGTVLGAQLFLADQVSVRVRWFSANAIVGPPYRADVLQFDIDARF